MLNAEMRCCSIALPHLVGVELRHQDQRLAVEQAAERAPLRGAVHQRRDHDAAPFVGTLGRGPTEPVLVGDLLPGVERDAAAEHADDILLPPHDTFRHPRGATRVQDVDVVIAARIEVTRG